MNKAARNERLKITAAYFNGAAIAALAVGGFAPVAATLGRDPGTASALLAFTVIAWFFLSADLHLLARMILRRVEE